MTEDGDAGALKRLNIILGIDGGSVQVKDDRPIVWFVHGKIVPSVSLISGQVADDHAVISAVIGDDANLVKAVFLQKL